MMDKGPIHQQPHPLAGKTVILNERCIADSRGMVKPGAEYRIEDWFDRLGLGSWMWAQGHPAALIYAMRSVATPPRDSLPIDDDVVYGKIGAFGHVVHASELGDLKP